MDDYREWNPEPISPVAGPSGASFDLEEAPPCAPPHPQELADAAQEDIQAMPQDPEDTPEDEIQTGTREDTEGT